MSDLDKLLTPLLKTAISDILKGEEIVINATQSIVEDEIKAYILRKLDDNPGLKRELKRAINNYMEARIRMIAAQMRVISLSAKLGILLIPEKVRNELSDEILSMFEKELTSFLEKTI